MSFRTHGHCGLVLGAKAKAHPRKAEKHDHGEDAFFVSESDAAFGVADGVSQWADYNIDAGEYSRKLMELCAEEVADLMSAEDARFADPKRALEKAYRRSLSVMGSSTACVLTMDGEGMLRAANLGDSGFIVLRPGFTRESHHASRLQPIAMSLNANAGLGPAGPNASQQEAIKKKRRAREIQWDVMYRSQEMQKYFNCPDQLGPGCPDKPSRAETYELPLETGDIILAATDGVFDNISDANLCVLVKRFSLELQSLLPTDQGAFSAASVKHDAELRPWLHSVADRICQEAHLVGMNTTGITPFSEQCRNAGYLFEGGKLDDVTVVAAMVVSKE
ncbi:Protein phosphatase PTC7-like fig [Hondaea fermentalgiana]|uniref:Protein phosphatase n=1 Tax=Hondaea fermentalgiana TaxID=2315210 RepID=A0A2R5GDQ1_9STRA|nr:Protein phosphatase PTC7-like fig [Hondaea fermentalgiana]|eukprot:GBG29077.1 Protein phosphatase PTC7-like fig [Hondaea fermentalgiana]